MSLIKIDMQRLEFFCPGRPQQQGSKTRTKFGMREDNRELVFWRNAVAIAARQAYGSTELITDPVHLGIVFLFSRPQSHYGTGRNAGTLKRSAPAHHAQTPDVDKLIRGVCDALSDVVYRDDRQVCSVAALRQWTREQPGARVTVCWAADMGLQGNGSFPPNRIEGR